MKEVRHIVWRTRFELRVKGIQNGPAVQVRATELLREGLGRCLDRVWEEGAPRRQHIRLERLEIDLGRVKGADWEEQCMDRLEEVLRGEMLHWNWEEPEPTELGQEQGNVPVRSIWEWLDAYLRNGNLPWWAPDPPAEAQWAQIRALLGRPSTELNHWLGQWAQDEAATARLLECIDLLTVLPHWPVQSLPPSVSPHDSPVTFSAIGIAPLLAQLYPFAGIMADLFQASPDLFAVPLAALDSLTRLLEDLLRFPWLPSNRSRLETVFQLLRDHWQLLHGQLSQIVAALRDEAELIPSEWAISTTTFARLPGSPARQQSWREVQLAVTTRDISRTKLEPLLRKAMHQLQLEMVAQPWASPWLARRWRGFEWPPIEPALVLEEGPEGEEGAESGEQTELSETAERVLKWLRDSATENDFPTKAKSLGGLPDFVATWTEAEWQGFVQALQFDPALQVIYAQLEAATETEATSVAPFEGPDQEYLAGLDGPDWAALRELVAELRRQLPSRLPVLEQMWSQMQARPESPVVSAELWIIWEEVQRQLEEQEIMPGSLPTFEPKAPELLDFIMANGTPETLANRLQYYLAQSWAASLHAAIQAWWVVLKGPFPQLPPEHLRGLRQLLDRLQALEAAVGLSAAPRDQLHLFAQGQLELSRAEARAHLMELAPEALPLSQQKAQAQWIKELEFPEEWEEESLAAFRTWLLAFLPPSVDTDPADQPREGHFPETNPEYDSLTDPWLHIRRFLNRSASFSPAELSRCLAELEPTLFPAPVQVQLNRWVSHLAEQKSDWSPELEEQIRFWLTALEMGREILEDQPADPAGQIGQNVALAHLKDFLLGKKEWPAAELGRCLKQVNIASEPERIRRLRKAWGRKLTTWGSQWEEGSKAAFRIWLGAWWHGLDVEQREAEGEIRAIPNPSGLIPSEISDFLRGEVHWSPAELAGVLLGWARQMHPTDAVEEVREWAEQLEQAGEKWDETLETGCREWLAQVWEREREQQTSEGGDNVIPRPEDVMGILLADHLPSQSPELTASKNDSGESPAEASFPPVFTDFIQELEADFRRQLDRVRTDIRPVPATSDDKIPVANAGLVLLGAFLPHFFTQLGFLDDRDFSSEALRHRTALLLEVLVREFSPDPHGQLFIPEFMLPLNKALCGIDPGLPLPSHLTPPPEELTECTRLLESAGQLWEAAGNLSPDGLRAAFLQRPGLLSHRDGHCLLQVETRPHDILLERLPWAFSIHKHPWMPEILKTEWKSQ